MPRPEPWYTNFFNGLIVEMWRQAVPDSQTQAEAEFLVKELAQPSGAKIADVPCGHGRLSLALAELGLAVTGVDFSHDALKLAADAAGGKNLPIHFERFDMRELPWRETFDAAFCFGNSFAYFDDAGNRAFLMAIHQILKPGGRFVLETNFAAEGVFTQLQPRRWFPFGDSYFLHDTRYDPATAQITSTYILIREGHVVERKEAIYRVYTFRQIMEMLAETGFSVGATYGSLKREPFQLGSGGLYVSAQRN
jgi:SAM-dependent methyltransferase